MPPDQRDETILCGNGAVKHRFAACHQQIMNVNVCHGAGLGKKAGTRNLVEAERSQRRIPRRRGRDLHPVFTRRFRNTVGMGLGWAVKAPQRLVAAQQYDQTCEPLRGDAFAKSPRKIRVAGGTSTVKDHCAGHTLLIGMIGKPCQHCRCILAITHCDDHIFAFQKRDLCFSRRDVHQALRRAELQAAFGNQKLQNRRAAYALLRDQLASLRGNDRAWFHLWSQEESDQPCVIYSGLYRIEKHKSAQVLARHAAFDHPPAHGQVSVRAKRNCALRKSRPSAAEGGVLPVRKLSRNSSLNASMS